MCAAVDVVRSFVELHSASVVCLQETKVSALCNRDVMNILGNGFDYVLVPSVGASGGVLLAWRLLSWIATFSHVGSFSASVSLAAVADDTT